MRRRRNHLKAPARIFRLTSTQELAGAGRCTGLAILLLLTAGVAAGQPGRKHAGTAAPAVEAERRIVVSISDHKLALIENGRVVKIYRVAVGKPTTPSPSGTFRIARRLTEPTYYHPGVVIPPGPDNPLGPRWLGLNLPGFGIHGTNEPLSIGHHASHGCVRMRNEDIVDLFSRVREGDAVELHGERDLEVAAIFGTGAAPSAGKTLVARVDEAKTATAPTDGNR